MLLLLLLLLLLLSGRALLASHHLFVWHFHVCRNPCTTLHCWQTRC
jgi:hypothetical protein